MVDVMIAGNLIVRDGELFLLHRRDHDYWELPGGKVEEGESAREAAVREAREELDCTVRLLSEWAPFRVEFGHEGRTFAARGFRAEIVDGEPTPEEEKFTAARWADAAALADLPLAPNLEMVRDDLQNLLRET